MDKQERDSHLVPDSRMHRAARQIGKAVHEYECIPIAALEAPERDKIISNLQKAGTLYGLMRKSLAPTV